MDKKIKTTDPLYSHSGGFVAQYAIIFCKTLLFSVSSICASSIFRRRLSEVRSSDRSLALASSNSRCRPWISAYISTRDGDAGRWRPSVILCTYPLLLLLGLDLELWIYGSLSREEKERRRLGGGKLDSFELGGKELEEDS